MKTPLRHLIPVALFASLLYSGHLQLLIFQQHTLTIPVDDYWTLTSFYGDAGEYLRLLDVPLHDGERPYKYRVVPILLARQLKHLGLSGAEAYLTLNAITLLITVYGFWLYLMRYHHFGYMDAIAGAVLLEISLTTTRTLLAPMVDVFSLFAALLVFVALQEQRTALFIPISIFAVASKEIFIAAAALWIINTDKRQWWAALVPLLSFALIRLALGGKAVEVGYDEGLFPYLFRLWTPAEWGYVSREIVLAFTFLWLGLLNIKQDDFLLKNTLIYVPLVIGAAVLMSSRVARVLGILYPVIIPLFLMYIPQSSQSNAR